MPPGPTFCPVLENAKGVTTDEPWLFSQESIQKIPEFRDPLGSRDPNNLVVDDRIAVNQNIAKSNYPVQVDDLDRGSLIQLSNRIECLADNFQLPFMPERSRASSSYSSNVVSAINPVTLSQA